MATTTNYGWTTPDDTALVKDGAAAIRTLGSSIDTSLNTALGTKKSGLVLLNTTSFSAVSAVSLATNTFSATYTNYRILFYITAKSIANVCRVRLRTSGTDNTSSTYDISFVGATGSGAFGVAVNNGTSFDPLDGTERTPNEVWIFDVLSPFAAVNTILDGTAYTTDAGTTIKTVKWTGRFENTTSFDSLSFNASTGTVTGSYSVYGYNA
jgi:hypothetical protein